LGQLWTGAAVVVHGATVNSGVSAAGRQCRRGIPGERLRDQREAEDNEQERGKGASHAGKLLSLSDIKTWTVVERKKIYFSEGAEAAH
jgi:hypothetical protein